MKSTYLIAHWILTLLLAPITSQCIQYVFGKNPHQIVGLLEVYPFALIFSFIFSVPTFIIYCVCFYFLSKRNIGLTAAKLILISISVFGVFITMTIMEGSMSREIIIAYSLTTIVIGLLLKIKQDVIVKTKEKEF